jgi:ankyrin repeat protein
MTETKTTEDAASQFLRVASVPRQGAHSSGTLDEAEAILAAHPEIAQSSLYTAAVLGNASRVGEILAESANAAEAVRAKGGPYDWDALTWLCFSRYLRIFRSDPARSAGFVQAAQLLLEAGADPNTGWFEPQPDGKSHWEPAIYGAAGIAQHPELTQLLLKSGADPNDEETPYHVAEGYDLVTLRVILESGKLNQDSLTTLLIRKADWHDYEGLQPVLEFGGDPHRPTRWGVTALQQATRRDNGLENIELLLNTGAGTAAFMASVAGAARMAAMRGRADVLTLLDRLGLMPVLDKDLALVAACALGDAEQARTLSADPESMAMLHAHGGDLLSMFAGNGNCEGIKLLVELGIPVSATTIEGDSYFSLAKGGTALHSAAWRARHSAVAALLELGAPVHAWNGDGETPLHLAIRACTDSYWMNRRSPESVRLLLQAGASVEGVSYPTGYSEVDALLDPRMKP